MKEKFSKLVDQSRAWMNERTMRERVLILVTSLVAVYSAGSLTLIDPVFEELGQLHERFDLISEQLERAQGRAADATRRMTEGPDAKLVRRAMYLEREIEALEGRLAAQRSALVSPTETARVLQELVGRNGKLRLRSLETLISEPVFAVDDRKAAQRSASESEADEVALYRHSFAIEAEGNYFAALGYLRAVEALPWGVYISRFDYEVSEYPNAVLRFELYTLSFKEAWIGV